MKFKEILTALFAVFFGVELIHCFMLKRERHELKKDLARMQKIFSIADRWLLLEINGDKLGKKIEKKGYKAIAVYGMGELGIRLIEEMKLHTSLCVLYGIDRNAGRISTYVPIYKLEEIQKLEQPDLIVVAAYCKDSSLEEKIHDTVKCDVINIEDLINE